MGVQGKEEAYMKFTDSNETLRPADFFPLSSAGLAYLFVILISGYYIGGTVISGILFIHRRLDIPSDTVGQPTSKF